MTTETTSTKKPVKRNNRFNGLNKSNAPEHKFIDTTAATYLATTTGSVTLINGIATGTDYNNRLGRKVEFTSVHVKGYVYPEDTTVVESFARLMVVWDSDVDGVAPTITDILAQSSSISFNNLNNRNRFRVLINEEFAIGAVQSTISATVGSTTGSPTVYPIDRFVKLPSLVQIAQGTTNTVASIQEGALWMVVIGNNGASNGSIFQVATRCRFTDS